MNGLKAVGILKAAFRISDLEPETINLYALKLGEIDEPLLEKILATAIERCKFFPSIAELLEIAAEFSPSGHLPPEEAWALVADLGEEDSVVWTDEIAAAYGIARGILPDRVGARMAFLESYRRQIAKAKEERRIAHWWTSLGWDKRGRAAAIFDAVERKRLMPGQASEFLPPEQWKWERIERQLPSGVPPRELTE